MGAGLDSGPLIPLNFYQEISGSPAHLLTTYWKESHMTTPKLKQDGGRALLPNA